MILRIIPNTYNNCRGKNLLHAFLTIMSHTQCHIILGAGVGASPDMIQDLGLEGGWGMVG